MVLCCPPYEGKYLLAPGHALVSGSEEHDGVCSSLGVTSGRIEQQCRTDVDVPQNARDSFLPNHFVDGKRISGLRVVGSIERGGLGPWGRGLRSGAGYGDVGLGRTHGVREMMWMSGQRVVDKTVPGCS